MHDLVCHDFLFRTTSIHTLPCLSHLRTGYCKPLIALVTSIGFTNDHTYSQQFMNMNYQL